MSSRLGIGLIQCVDGERRVRDSSTGSHFRSAPDCLHDLLPITQMMTDHDQTSEELQTLRKLTNNYTPPPEACPTLPGLYRAIEELETDLHQHIHLENNILFPRALAEAEKEKTVFASGYLSRRSMAM